MHRAILLLLLLVALTIPSGAFAQKRGQMNLRIGWNVSPVSKGRISGPPSVRVLSCEEFPFDERLSIEGEGLYAVLSSERWELTPGIGYIFVGYIGSPGFRSGDFRGWEIFIRHTLWRHGLVQLYGVGSLARLDPVTERIDGYDFNYPFFLPGLGIGGNASIVRGEVKFHWWPGLEIGKAREAVSGPGYCPYREEPIRLKYMLSVHLGIEFTLLKF